MSASYQVTTSVEAPPLVRVFANTLTLALQQPGTAALLDRMTGTFALKSSKGPQSVSIRVNEGWIHLSPGVAAEALVVVEMDFKHPDRKPRVRGLLRHPLYAMNIDRLLSIPPPNWTDSAHRFWSAIRNQPDLPDRITIECTDDHQTLTLGDGADNVLIQGNAAALAEVLAGNDLLVAQAAAHKVRFQGSLQHLVGLSAAGQKLLLGEIHGDG